MNYQWLIHGGDRTRWVWHYWRIYFEAYCTIPAGLDTVFLTEQTPIPKEWAPIRAATTGKMAFTSQLLKYFDRCRAKYILYSMDDFFLLGQPDFEKINALVDIMKYKGIKLIKLFGNKHTTAAMRESKPDSDGLHIYEFWRPYIISCQPSIWEKEFLMSSLLANKTGAQFEIHGSLRCKQNAMCYTDPNIFPYKEGIRGGKIRAGSEHLFEKSTLPKKAQNDKAD